MSRVGKVPVVVPDGVNIEISDLSIKVTGPKGALNKSFIGQIAIEKKENSVVINPLDDTISARSMWGTARSIIHGMVTGVTIGFREELEVNGVGYRASIKGKYLNLVLGKSHNTKIEIPVNIKVTTPKQNIIILESNNKEQLGQYVAVICSQRPPEPYKGKGIKRVGQYVQRKEGKKG